MSRSRRKTPIFGIAICASERADKKIWHHRFRTRERQTLTSMAPQQWEAHLGVQEREVSNVWAMGKDGRGYFSPVRQEGQAEWVASRKGKTEQERSALKLRRLAKWRGK